MDETDKIYSLSGKRVWVAGHGGMVGRALIRRLSNVDCEVLKVTRGEIDLRRQRESETWIEANNPQVIIIAAARVGGILANATYPAEFLYDNLIIEANIIQAAYRNSVEKLLFLGSSCIYPKFAVQPIKEDALLTGALEPTNEWYAIAKIAGIKLCQSFRKQYGCDFISAMPTNLYGPWDNFNPHNSHVLPSLIRKVHEAKEFGKSEIEIWGTGKPRREFLHVDDAADGIIFLLENYSEFDHVNLGVGWDLTIDELVHRICSAVGYEGGIVYNEKIPDGTPCKRMDISKISELGWKANTNLDEGIKETYAWFLDEFTKTSTKGKVN